MISVLIISDIKTALLNFNPIGQGWIGVELFLVISGSKQISMRTLMRCLNSSMKRSMAIWVNISFRVFVALAYTLLGAYVAFWSAFDLGEWVGVQITLLLGILFMLYGLFRIWRAYLYFREADESSNYAEYED